MPWKILDEASPGKRAPRDGEQWRINFSRVEWHTDIVDGRYVKRRTARRRSRCPKTTGSGARRARSTCTCRSAGA